MTTLIIPTLHIKDGQCVRPTAESYVAEPDFFADPVEMARLWRVQNAKVLHIVDVNSIEGDTDANRDTLREVCCCLDIPVQVVGGMCDFDRIEESLACGASRVVVDCAATARDPQLIELALKRFEPRRIVLGVDAWGKDLVVPETGFDGITLSVLAEKLGCCRVIYADLSRVGTLKGPDTELYRNLGSTLERAAVTVAGGVAQYRDLLQVTELSPYRVDSVIIGRALYENRFPCQQFWCWNDKTNVNLDRFTTAKNDG